MAATTSSGTAVVTRWWSGDRGEVTSAEVDLRVGGTWRYVLTANEVFEGMPDAQSVDTVTLTEKDGRTTFTMLVQHERREHRDALIDSGMEGGMQEAMDHLERVAVSLR